MSEDNIIKVGVACLVLKEGKVLLGERISKTHGSGEYTCGGGHVKFHENLTEAVRREITEEWNIEISEPEYLCTANLRKYDKHYVEIVFKANWISGEPSPKNDGEFANFAWYNLDDLPSPLFGNVSKFLEALQTDKRYFETEG